MYIDKILLKNIRGFEDLAFSLRRADGSHAGWTVFTGDNGAGKSTLLKAIAIGLVGPDTVHSLQPGFERWVRESPGVEDGTIALDIAGRKHDDYDDLGDLTPGSEARFQVMVNLTRRVDGAVTVAHDTDGSGAVVRLWSTDVYGYFVCGYGPFRRVFGASPEATRLMSSPKVERFVTMFQEAASLFEVDQWLRRLNHKALEGRIEQKAQLDLLLEILRDDLMPNQITVDRVDSDGLWLRDRNGLQLAWGDMSDGYRSAVALLADILRHMIKAYGLVDLAERDADGKLFINRSGVVLIDEIDAHLHPEWQREIGFWLKRHFPLVQFLVTTHSPIICQAADDNGLFVLPEPGSGDSPRPLSRAEYETVIAARPDTILLTPAFGLQNTRSPRAVKGRADYAKLQAKMRAGASLSQAENSQLSQLRLFANTNEEQ